MGFGLEGGVAFSFGRADGLLVLGGLFPGGVGLGDLGGGRGLGLAGGLFGGLLVRSGSLLAAFGQLGP
ncbi:hypothetical protein GCM10010140_60760 [Streptosporangium pseudovulgare]|uniref:Uncharacterized protein n=1 Tax=Streptosporangium pseudovulgare TaxID=35765 RepID=A0ABQ2REC3_9ACTN|nr:hypothetical protein GCM10010140_60760 [Streptosporangium pseudovulgare]